MVTQNPRRLSPLLPTLALATAALVGCAEGVVESPGGFGSIVDGETTTSELGPRATAGVPTSRAKSPFPELHLPDPAAFGERAIEVLGDRLPEVAAWYGKSPDELAALLRNDHSMKIDRAGRVFFEEADDVADQAGAATGASSAVVTAALQPLEQTFLLHSRPASQRTLYLDFTGGEYRNTVFGTFTAAPFDLDSDPSTFSPTELERIQGIWQRVVEDYAPFDVDITTEEPPADRLTRSSSSDAVFGSTVLITVRDSTPYSCSCGGVSYLSIFDDTTDYYKPSLVFFDRLAYDEKYIAEAIAHESGHGVGLHHDGTSSANYYSGQGNWAPIMGVGYYKAVSQWSKGEYAGANNVEDDLALIQQNGMPLRLDDHGNAVGKATPLTVSAQDGVATLYGSGVVASSSDIDVFSFIASAGTLSLSVTPASRAPNLDLAAELYDASGHVLAASGADDSLGAQLVHEATAPGTFYVVLRGAGSADPVVDGYSAYASVGQFEVRGTVPASNVAQPPVAVPTVTTTSGTAPLAVGFSGGDSYDPDGSIVAYEWSFGDGSAPRAGVDASWTYETPGTYQATLTVTDNSGLSSALAVTIIVAAPVPLVNMYVADIAMSLQTSRSGSMASAVVTVRDAEGRVVPGASVSGTWSGLTSGSSVQTTTTSGVATFKSVRSKKGGTFVFTVTGVSLSGYAYQPSSNIETSDAITR